MVNKSLTFIALLLCALLAEQATGAAAKKKQSKKVEESDDEESSSDGSDTEDDAGSDDKSDEDDSDDEGSKKKSSKKSSISSKSTKGESATRGKAKSSKDGDSTDTKNRFVLTGFKKSSVRGTRPLKHTWKTKSYRVRFERERGITVLEWKKGSDEVAIAVSPRGKIAQAFKFGKVIITMAATADGKLVQDWQVGNSHYQVIKMVGMGTINNGILNALTINKYKKLISSWCKANDFFVGKGNCVIF